MPVNKFDSNIWAGVTWIQLSWTLKVYVPCVPFKPFCLLAQEVTEDCFVGVSQQVFGQFSSQKAARG